MVPGSGLQPDSPDDVVGALGVAGDDAAGEADVPTGPQQAGEPGGDPYDWYQRAMSLLDAGSPEAALQLIERLLAIEPGSSSVREAHARALFDARRYEEAARAFESILEQSPDDDYAHFGLGMCLWRRQLFVRARDELAMAFVMRPSRSEYARALSQVKATLRARIADGLPLNGPLGGDRAR